MEGVIERAVRELRSEADIDIISLPLIAESIREDLNIENQQSIIQNTIKVVSKLTEMNIYPGDYIGGSVVRRWIGDREDWLKRIQDEWITLGHTPTLEHPICWFGLKKPDLA